MLFKSIATSLTIILAIGGTQNVSKAGITEIGIQNVTVTFNGNTQNLRITGAQSIIVEFDDATSTTYVGASFNLNTLGMVGDINGDPTSISYDGGPGVMNLSDASANQLLLTSLSSLDLALSPIIGPGGIQLPGSLLAGEGSFIVNVDNLGFGSPVGALYTAAYVFDDLNTPNASFDHGFQGTGSVTLIPTAGPLSAVPEIASFGIWGVILLMGVATAGSWKRRRIA